jgi:hypothetical protein
MALVLPPILIDATTRLVRGSIFETIPELPPATQTAPSPTARPAAPRDPRRGRLVAEPGVEIWPVRGVLAYVRR